MKNREQEELQQYLAELTTAERNKIYQRAGKLRKTAVSQAHGKRAPGLDELVLRLLREEQVVESPEISGTRRGLLVALAAGRGTVRCGEEELDCPLHPRLARQQQSAVAVGDEVMLDEQDGMSSITGVLPRRTSLSRPDPQHAHIERVVAANMDVVVLVVAVKAPPLHPRLLDRYLLAVERGGARPFIAVTKVDLLTEAERMEALAVLQPYRALGIDLALCSTVTGEGLDELHAALRGQRCVVVGHSGVGKSSLINALDPSRALATNTLRASDGKGRHTTTASRLYRLDGAIEIIDTPGVREFGIWQMSAGEMAQYFHEFAPYAAACKFADCTHTHEPGCAVKQAVRDGQIPRARYVSYRRLRGESDDGEEEEAVTETSFTCAHCGQPVPPACGSAHRNHCPLCLWSVHLDDTPGDRASCCGGLLEPVSVWVRQGGEWALIHRCRDCGAFRSNRIAGDDNELLLMSLAVRPLAKPPFRLEDLTAGKAE